MVPGTIACPGGMGSCSMLSQLVEPLFVSLFRDCTGNPPLYRALEHAKLFDVSELTATFGSNEVYTDIQIASIILFISLQTVQTSQTSQYDFTPFVNELTNEILSSAIRTNIRNLPVSMNISHLTLNFNRILTLPTLSSSVDAFSRELNDLAEVYTDLVCWK